jgi:hypothetical protein
MRYHDFTTHTWHNIQFKHANAVFMDTVSSFLRSNIALTEAFDLSAVCLKNVLPVTWGLRPKYLKLKVSLIPCLMKCHTVKTNGQAKVQLREFFTIY